jgi:predicted transcriptional regulator
MEPAKNLKDEAHRLVDQLPPDASWDDLMYEVYVRQSVEAGLDDVSAGRVVTHDEALAKLRPRR